MQDIVDSRVRTGFLRYLGDQLRVSLALLPQQIELLLFVAEDKKMGRLYSLPLVVGVT